MNLRDSFLSAICKSVGFNDVPQTLEDFMKVAGNDPTFANQFKKLEELNIIKKDSQNQYVIVDQDRVTEICGNFLGNIMGGKNGK